LIYKSIPFLIFISINMKNLTGYRSTTGEEEISKPESNSWNWILVFGICSLNDQLGITNLQGP